MPTSTPARAGAIAPSAVTVTPSAQAPIVDGPVAVLDTVEEDHGQPVAVLNPQFGVTGAGPLVDVDLVEALAHLVTNPGQVRTRGRARTTPAPAQQHDSHVTLLTPHSLPLWLVLTCQAAARPE